jgi:hypothetical protein
MLEATASHLALSSKLLVIVNWKVTVLWTNLFESKGRRSREASRRKSTDFPTSNPAPCVSSCSTCKHTNRYTEHTPTFTYLARVFELPESVISGPHCNYATFYIYFSVLYTVMISCWDITATTIATSCVTNFHIINVALYFLHNSTLHFRNVHSWAFENEKSSCKVPLKWTNQALFLHDWHLLLLKQPQHDVRISTTSLNCTKVHLFSNYKQSFLKHNFQQLFQNICLLHSGSYKHIHCHISKTKKNTLQAQQFQILENVYHTNMSHCSHTRCIYQTKQVISQFLSLISHYVQV